MAFEPRPSHPLEHLPVLRSFLSAPSCPFWRPFSRYNFRPFLFPLREFSCGSGVEPGSPRGSFPVNPRLAVLPSFRSEAFPSSR